MRHVFTYAIATIALCACVAKLEVSNNPCPCPKGYLCCPTTNTCVSDEVYCPDTYPPSSGSPCKSDAECESGEICMSWQESTGYLAGPKKCRKSCDEALSCSQGESCDLILHDGAPLEVTNLKPACVPSREEGECKGLGCIDFERHQVGGTYCHNQGIYGCFMSLHPNCGITCIAHELYSCGNDVCVEGDSGASCPSAYAVDLCLTGDCTVGCPSGLEPGKLACDGDSLIACTKLPMRDIQVGDCDFICRDAVVKSCENGCESLPVPHCN